MILSQNKINVRKVPDSLTILNAAGSMKGGNTGNGKLWVWDVRVADWQDARQFGGR
jgi:hypothetical protein